MTTEFPETVDNKRQIVSIDLFCGAGGFSEGVKRACSGLGYELQHGAVNHWDIAVQSHQANHSDAVQFHSRIEQLHPPDVVNEIVDKDVRDVHTDDINVDLLTAGPECTHFSSARGGKPVCDQKRASPWAVLRYLEQLTPSSFIIENVPEFKSWGPIEDGQPTRDGTIFDAWINAANQLGYSTNWTTLNAADYGDPTSRNRFFIIGQRDTTATFPEPTHSDTDDTLPNRRTAADIIDWTDRGTSIWTRDLTEPRVHSPPKDTTLKRIATGIREHSPDWLSPIARTLETFNRDDIRTLRESRVVAPQDVQTVAAAVDTPFLTPICSPTDESTDTQPSPDPSSSSLAPLLLRQQDGGSPVDVMSRSLPTIPTAGAHALVVPSLIMPKNGPQGDIHSNSLYHPKSQPLHTLTSDPRAALLLTTLSSPSPKHLPHPVGTSPIPSDNSVSQISSAVPSNAASSDSHLYSHYPTPFINNFQTSARSIYQPLNTHTAKTRFALCIPELNGIAVDIKYRMLKPTELKQAQGFPQSYTLTGTKTERIKSIGNAVPVSLATNLCKHVLSSTDPSLSSFGGGLSNDSAAEIPSYDEVAGD
jgi:DNA (cytosine-5)-methyltransferase 1